MEHKIQQLFSNKIMIGHATHQGRRKYQEDSYGHRFESDGSLLVVLADGMGGHNGGDVASQTAVGSFGEFYQRSTDQRIPDKLVNALYYANRKIVEQANSNESISDMGTTTVAASVQSEVLHWVSVGDSLLYLIRGGQLLKLNAEHSLGSKMERLLALGKITQEEFEATKEPQGLTSSLGREDLAEVDSPYNPTLLKKDDKLVIASDGLSTLSNNKVISIVNSIRSPQRAADALIELVLKENRPTQDNVTVLVIHHEVDEIEKPEVQDINTVRMEEKSGGSDWLIYLVAALSALLLLGVIGWWLVGDKTQNSEVAIIVENGEKPLKDGEKPLKDGEKPLKDGEKSLKDGGKPVTESGSSKGFLCSRFGLLC